MDTRHQDFEIKYYSEIMEFFETFNSDPYEAEIWRSQILIKLMNDLKYKRITENVVSNSIIIINALLEDIPTDILHSQGVLIENLTLEEKIDIKSELEREFLIA